MKVLALFIGILLVQCAFAKSSSSSSSSTSEESGSSEKGKNGKLSQSQKLKGIVTAVTKRPSAAERPISAGLPILGLPTNQQLYGPLLPGQISVRQPSLALQQAGLLPPQSLTSLPIRALPYGLNPALLSSGLIGYPQVPISIAPNPLLSSLGANPLSPYSLYPRVLSSSGLIGYPQVPISIASNPLLSTLGVPSPLPLSLGANLLSPNSLLNARVLSPAVLRPLPNPNNP